MFPPLALPLLLAYNLAMLLVDLLAVRQLRRSPERLPLVTTRTALISLLLALAGPLLTGDRFALILLLCHALFFHAPLLALAVGLLRRDRVGAAYAALAVALLAVATDAFVLEPGDLQLSEHTVPVAGLSRPHKVVLLADLQTDDPDDGHTRRALELALAQQPDLILLAGDYVQHPQLHPHLDLIARFNALAHEVGLRAPLGVIAVQGNVEHPRRWPELFYGLPVNASSQTQTLHTGELAITALSFEDGFNPELRLPAPRRPHLVLAHAPDFALGEVEADLLFAGHTHGGQVQLPWIGPLMTLSSVPRQWAAGLTVLPSGAHLIVSRGVGMERDLAPRLRFFCRPEVVVLHLVPLSPLRRLALATSALGAATVGAHFALQEVEQAERTDLLEQTAPAPSARTDDAAFLAPITRGQTFREFEVLSRPVAHALPDDLRALVYFFHGTGGSSRAVEQTETLAVLQPLIEAGFGVVAPTMQAREAEGKFDADTPPERNPDIERMIAIFRGLREADILPEHAPIFLIGYSAGGRFAGLAGHALLRAGLPLRAIAYHQARGRTERFGAPPPVPSVWLAADHDTMVDPGSIAWEHSEHVAAGQLGLLLRHVPRPVAPGDFTRNAAIDPLLATDLWMRLRAEDLFAADHTLLLRATTNEAVDRLTQGLPPNAQAALREQLKVLAATHAFNGEYAAQELTFFEAQLAPAR